MALVLVLPYVQTVAKRLKARGRKMVPTPKFSEVWVIARPKLDSLLGFIFSGFFYVYFIVVKTALGIFDCVTDKTTHESTLDGNPNVACSRATQPYGRVYPFGIAGMVVYGIGIPVVFGIVFFKYRREIQADQVCGVLREWLEGSAICRPACRALRLCVTPPPCLSSRSATSCSRPLFMLNCGCAVVWARRRCVPLVRVPPLPQTTTCGFASVTASCTRTSGPR